MDPEFGVRYNKQKRTVQTSVLRFVSDVTTLYGAVNWMPVNSNFDSWSPCNRCSFWSPRAALVLGFLWDGHRDTHVEDGAHVVSHVEQDNGTDNGGSASNDARTRLGIRAARPGSKCDTTDEGSLTQDRGVPLEIRISMRVV